MQKNVFRKFPHSYWDSKGVVLICTHYKHVLSTCSVHGVINHHVTTCNLKETIYNLALSPRATFKLHTMSNLGVLLKDTPTSPVLTLRFTADQRPPHDAAHCFYWQRKRKNNLACSTNWLHLQASHQTTAHDFELELATLLLTSHLFSSSPPWLKLSHWHEWETDFKTMSANGSWEQGW